MSKGKIGRGGEEGSGGLRWVVLPRRPRKPGKAKVVGNGKQNEGEAIEMKQKRVTKYFLFFSLPSVSDSPPSRRNRPAYFWRDEWKWIY